MIYFDTDVLVHAIVQQDVEKNKFAKSVFYECIESKSISISLLSVQEIAFVLGKLKINPFIIQKKVEDFIELNPNPLTIPHYIRAAELATKIGFTHFNDCLHTAIAESYCQELYTYNKKDFEKIKSLTPLKITIF